MISLYAQRTQLRLNHEENTRISIKNKNIIETEIEDSLRRFKRNNFFF